MFRAVCRIKSIFAMLLKIVVRMDFLLYFIKVIHEFSLIWFCGNPKKQSKTAERLYKRSKTQWQSKKGEWLLWDVNFTQNKVEIFWHWHWFRSAYGWKIRMVHNAVQMGFSHKNYLKKYVQNWSTFSLTSPCSQPNTTDYLHE